MGPPVARGFVEVPDPDEVGVPHSDGVLLVGGGAVAVVHVEGGVLVGGEDGHFYPGHQFTCGGVVLF